MFESLPGAEAIYIERVKPAVYCGTCMQPMQNLKGVHFECAGCGRDYERDQDIVV
jgi:predicted RNA-binding Zn-ribbon protein involved in translation (DUF1610 family)